MTSGTGSRMDGFEAVLPGDKVPLPSPHVGPGLCVAGGDCSTAVVTTAGLLKGVEPEGKGNRRTTWVDYSAKRVREEEVVHAIHTIVRYVYLYNCACPIPVGTVVCASEINCPKRAYATGDGF